MQARTKATIAAVFAWSCLAVTGAQARKAGKPKAPSPPNADQQEVVAQIVNETFRRPRRAPLTLALCLDVQIAPAFDEDAAPPPPPPRRGRRKAAPAPEVPPPPVIQGAPPELVAALARPWRVVASALSCRLDPRAPFTINDAAHTPAQLVTVHLAPEVASGTVQIDWTSGHDSAANGSRDCTATRAPRGWSVHCGGTWFQ